jgi:CheY-like chemotaxis protein
MMGRQEVIAVQFLVVEDDPVMQQVIVAMLQRLGHRARVAADGQAAIDACRADAPECLLMDLQMPRLDGLSATRELRRLQRDEGLRWFPIIVASAFYTPADRGACFDAGADGFVTKPLMLAKLGAELCRVLAPRAPTLPGWERDAVERDVSDELAVGWMH